MATKQEMTRAATAKGSGPGFPEEAEEEAAGALRGDFEGEAEGAYPFAACCP